MIKEFTSTAEEEEEDHETKVGGRWRMEETLYHVATFVRPFTKMRGV